ncbi:AAA family ATPase [Actinomadura sp. DC4]|uniref:AAA family ATPase n=1 Tax=Actinomadura sp. DC4 TaxID=3055069 RepID=UPI0025B0C230|nr:AAA family ATPase [Actinomadura sp. DC4]MDN3354504.1 AAA family ATPase [Actinomadura sp. DC4]
MAPRVGRTADVPGGRVTHGLVVGKFYPPHAGHHHLIDTAAAGCDRLTVVVAASPLESIPIALRAAWLRERHPQPHVDIVAAVDDIEIDYDSDAVWTAHAEIFTTAARDPVDVVFSSEEYGPELARRLGAAHVAVDPARERFPVSGTAVRQDHVATWRWLSPPVRAHLTRRVVVVGAESSGTTTLARALAGHYARRGGVWAATRLVPEYGRLYCEEKLAIARRRDPGLWLGDLEWASEEFAVIAERQLALEDAAARAGSPLLVCDTDAFATELWHERYVGTPAPALARTPHDLWILTDTAGVPFEQDGWRDGEAIRVRMSARFAAELERRCLPHVTVSGPHDVRLATAVDAIDTVLDKSRAWTDAGAL